MKSDNELIAEFMGLLVFPNTEEMQAYPLDKLIEWVYPYQIKYYESWDWLMPVVEKIDNLNDGKYIVTIEPMITIISNMGEAPIVEIPFSNRLQNTYKAVVEFIKWYNLQET